MRIKKICQWGFESNKGRFPLLGLTLYLTLVEKMDFDEKQMIRKIAMREKFECTKSECTKIPRKYVNPNVRKSEIGQKKF